MNMAKKIKLVVALLRERALAPARGRGTVSARPAGVSEIGEALPVRGVSPCSYYLALAGNLMTNCNQH